MPTKLEVGRRGEQAAVSYLSGLGFRILHTNLRLGRLGELDIVARDGSTLVLVEVKSKIAGQPLGGLENVTATKQRKLRDLGQLYLQKYRGDHRQVRFDVIEVRFENPELRSSSLTHVTDAFRA